MRRPPIAALSLAFAATLASCSRTEAPPEETAPPDPVARSEFSELGSEAASKSFTERIESQLDDLELAQFVDSALVRNSLVGEPVEIVYIFANMGGANTVAPLMETLSDQLANSEIEDCWMPWPDLAETSQKPGPCMGVFRHRSGAFQLTLWLDVTARHLFVSYSSPAPEHPAPALIDSPLPAPQDRPHQ